MIELPKGTIENVAVEVTDDLENITDLTGSSPVWAIYNEFDKTTILQTGSGTVPVGAPMTVLCLINTTTLGRDRYELYVSFSHLPETPQVGPFIFKII